MTKPTLETSFRGKPVVAANNGAAWRRWLAKHGEAETAVWLVIYKKESGQPSVYYPEAVDEALCYGWVDSAIAKRDADSYYQYFAKRNPKSNWSAVNKAKVDKLMAAGKMAPPGLAMVELAKTSGTWDALNEVEKLSLPNDLQQAFAKAPKAAKVHWDAFPRSVRRGILEWINTAKKPETRAQRIDKTVAMAADNKRAQFDK